VTNCAVGLARTDIEGGGIGERCREKLEEGGCLHGGDDEGVVGLCRSGRRKTLNPWDLSRRMVLFISAGFALVRATRTLLSLILAAYSQVKETQAETSLSI
jgi:hypothetical protein